MFVQINHNNNTFNVDVKINYSDENLCLAVKERLWESETAFVESRSFDSEVELVYSECNSFEQDHQELFSQVMRELDFWSETIASSREREEHREHRRHERHEHQRQPDRHCDEPPEWLYIPTPAVARAHMVEPCTIFPPEWMFVSRARTY